jgi:hypothetical protein
MNRYDSTPPHDPTIPDDPAIDAPHPPGTYDQAARYLDGETATAEPAAQSVADDVRRDESEIQSQLPVPLPKTTERKTRRKLRAQTSSEPQRVWRAFLIGLLAAAAVALVLWTLKTFMP